MRLNPSALPDGIADSTRALKENHGAIRDILAKISLDCDEKTQTKLEAAGLVAKHDKLETVITTMGGLGTV